nr:hypothetical protein [uncultured Pedobacter sp.]
MFRGLLLFLGFSFSRVYAISGMTLPASVTFCMKGVPVNLTFDVNNPLAWWGEIKKTSKINN